MNKKKLFGLTTLLALSAEMGTAAPPVVAPTRPELKQQLEGSKKSKPRLPLPAPSDQEIDAAKRSPNGMLSGIINNGRMRKLYLPAELVSGGFSREKDPAITLDYPAQTKLFWIVSRGNNCTYCQGHQESKLASAGVNEETIAALDGAWDRFTPAEQAAFAFTRKLTLRPDIITDADINALRPFYSGQAIVEIAMVVSGFNWMNRWTEGLAIPQEDHRVYLTPTSAPFQNFRSVVAPLDPSAKGLACAAPSPRPALESREQVEAALKAARLRQPRLPLASETDTRALLPPDASAGPVPAWQRLLAQFPKTGKNWIGVQNKSATAGKLDPRLRAEIAWIAARNDRAWYALDIARKRLAALGFSDDAMFALDHPGVTTPAGQLAVIALARKLTVDPALVEDSDIAALRTHFSDREVAEVVFQITQAAFFDRLTEAAALPLDAESTAALSRR
jgi:alkylhydroperoxidase family enzyme